MTTIAIQSENEEHLGFLLIADQEEDPLPPGTNDCIFTGSPRDSALFNTPEALFLLDHKHEEWEAQIANNETGKDIRIRFSTGWTFDLRIEEAGSDWSATQGEQAIHGKALIL